MIQATLYLLHYNNYYNRQVKKENSLSAYLSYQIGEAITGVNFITNDYINTEQIINWNYDNPDYLVVVDENGNINSRWFIISTNRTRAGQLRLELHRDLVVDFYNEVVNAPCFIEKAMPKSIRDPAIYNSEDMTFNQIKQSEHLLYDETKCPWIVGYIPRDSFKTDTTVSLDAQLAGSADITVEHLADYPYYKYNNSIVSGKVTNPTIRIAVMYWIIMSGGTQRMYGNSIKLNESGNYIGLDQGSGQTTLHGYYWLQTNTSPLYTPSNKFTDEYARIVSANMPQLAEDFKNLSDYVSTSGISESEYNQLIKDNGKVIYESSSGKYFKIRITGSTSSSSGTTTYIPWESSLGIKMKEKMVTTFDGHELKDPVNPSDLYNSPFSFTSDTAYQSLSFEPVEVKLSVKVPATRYQASESPYDIFCMPYSDTLTIKKSGEVYVEHTNKSSAITLAQAIMAEVGSNNIYDIQLLPYCPVRYCIQSDGSFDIGSSIYTDIKADTDTVGVLLWATTDNFTFNLPINIPEEQTVLAKKVKNQTEFIRICSPNFGNAFEFKPQMNEGLDYVSVLCHYKPFNPYIKIQPNFKGLYGNSFNDSRGLICNGDFSLAQVTSAWADYELQSKNYQAMFNREMQNLQVNNSVQREREIWGVASGTLSAGVSGATAGTMAAGPFGALAGLATAGASLAGGIRDIQLNDKLRNEAIDYKRDMFGYQLQNIQAIPQGLAKTSAISPDNKFVPFIEFYSCTDTEKTALENKIKYDGCTIMMIDNIANYQISTPTYIKGRLIRLDNIDEDYHIINAIANEVYQGVFI